MSETEAFVQANQLFTTYVAQITDGQWDKPTPNAEWSIRDLVAHVADENRWVPELLAGKYIKDVGDKLAGDPLGENPVQSWKQVAEAAESAAQNQSDPDQTVHLSYGDMPAREYLKHIVIDHVIHSWDLARAIGADETLDEKLVQTAYEWLEPQAEIWRNAGAFGPAQPTSPDASLQTKLIALSGRQV